MIRVRWNLTSDQFGLTNRRSRMSAHVSLNLLNKLRERSGSVVERLTRDRRAAGSSLTGVTALCP